MRTELNSSVGLVALKIIMPDNRLNISGREFEMSIKVVDCFDEVNYLALELLEKMGIELPNEGQVVQAEKALRELILIARNSNWQNVPLTRTSWISELIARYQQLAKIKLKSRIESVVRIQTG